VAPPRREGLSPQGVLGQQETLSRIK